MPDSSVSVKNLKVKFGDFEAVKNVTFDVKAGEIFGFLGANGAGKTTTIRVLCGLLGPTEGEVVVAGTSFEHGKNSMKIKSKVGYMSQKFTLYNDLSVEENLSFMASLRKLEKEYFHKRRDELFKFISFKEDPKTIVKDLPGGVKQQISLVAAILHDPEVIFLDEPTAGVTPVVRARFWKLIKELARNKKTVFVTSHYMDEVEQCDRIALMRSGELIALDSPEELKKKNFPEKLYELIPKKDMPYEEAQRLKKEGHFKMFEPHGLSFHVAAENEESWEKFSEEHKDDFDFKEIRPSLEDVFIRLVEGKDR